MLTAEIFSQGDEVVTGQVADTNAAWLSERLTALGFVMMHHSTVGDRLPDLITMLRRIDGRTRICVCTGGLGPTEDDLTAEAAAAAFHKPLALDPRAMHQIEQFYARIGRVMPEVNRKQAWLPLGAERLDNHWGTAPGFAIEGEGTWFAFLPGVPREMKQIFSASVQPILEARHDLKPWGLVTLRTIGVGESTLQERLTDLDIAPLVLSYRTKLPENHVKLRVPPNTSTARLQDVVREIAHRIGSPLFTIEGGLHVDGYDCEGGDLASFLGRTLTHRDETLAVAESCTGGRVAAHCTAHAGSSSWFLEGAVTYSNIAKIRMLGVDPSTLAVHGAVSEPVARQMAEGVRSCSGATYGLATTGIAGPNGGSSAKPVGTVHIAAATPSGTTHRLLRLSGDRNRIQILAASSAIDLLRQHLQYSA